MCLTPIVEYVPRPVTPTERPEGAPPSLADHDPNLYGPKPVPPSWEANELASVSDESHTHSSNQTGATTSTAAIAAAVAMADPAGTRLESVIIELPSGRRLLITEL